MGSIQDPGILLSAVDLGMAIVVDLVVDLVVNSVVMVGVAVDLEVAG